MLPAPGWLGASTTGTAQASQLASHRVLEALDELLDADVIGR
jgi:hypothetical protein